MVGKCESWGVSKNKARSGEQDKVDRDLECCAQRSWLPFSYCVPGNGSGAGNSQVKG